MDIFNIAVIAHIDHGKTSLIQQLLKLSGKNLKNEPGSLEADYLEAESRHGITIKTKICTINLKVGGKDYQVNIIDTPGHVDFSYEVSRALFACEAALLIVDSTQGVEAQTIINAQRAESSGVELLPVINKIDLKNSNPENAVEEIESILKIEASEAPRVSAKTGQGIEGLAKYIVQKTKRPKIEQTDELKALVFDSYYDNYRGVVIYVRMISGTLKPKDLVSFIATKKNYEVEEVGHVCINVLEPLKELKAGDVGFVTASIKKIQDIKIGDTIVHSTNANCKPLEGFKEVKPMVFCGIYPIQGDKYNDLKDALEKLSLNDSSFSFEFEKSKALGFGFICGFLGLLHMQVTQERLEEEYGIDLIATAPSVAYKVLMKTGEVKLVSNPTNYPSPDLIQKTEEPIVSASIMTPADYIGRVMELCQARRGQFLDLQYIAETRANLNYLIPLGEIVFDFFDELKSKTKGYASLDYEPFDYGETKLSKLDVLISGEVVDALSLILPADRAQDKGRRIAEKLKEYIPRQLFDVPIQAAIGGKIIARETVKALRKDVLAKCYGGDITRKKKLLEKQKAGKKRMRKLGSVEVPQEAFLAVLKLGD